MPQAAFWSGWILFAGLMMLLIGAFNAPAARWDEAQADMSGTVSGT